MYGRCPACGYTWEPGYGWTEDQIIIPVHPASGTGYLTADTERCWLAGWDVAAGKSMIRMRTENGGRLMRTAHP